MALGTNKVSALATPGMTAAATARPASGGRNVASVNGGPAEAAGFSSQIGVNDNRLLRYDDELDFGFSEHHEPGQQGTPFMSRLASSFQADLADEAVGGGSSGIFMDYVMRGVGTYEHNMRVTTPGSVRPGSVINYMY
ncbi:hypothetical protein [Magnetospirillum sulfuroxidans]|uniref:Uncharacterized protein n=1 Tax=Magnetospirillum sulfuroxidans TaxID=611300 RepID=A0ABS5IGG3_9PROT|nr:hypothetical protein [Magnetospirillum sulfuroxidans]MBR9973529.1 hypothetical protein [Magnetospirillum sulfuroxidans]